MLRIGTDRSKSKFKLLWFVVVFGMTFIVLLAMWGTAIPLYNRVVVLSAAPLFQMVEEPNVTAVRADSSEVWIYRTGPKGEVEPFSYFDPYMYFGIIPLLALLIATPGPGWIKWLTRIGTGVALMFLAHVIYLVGSVELTYAAVGLNPILVNNKPLLDWMQILVRTFWQAAPMVIYISISFGFWRNELRFMRGNVRRAHRTCEVPRRGGLSS